MEPTDVLVVRQEPHGRDEDVIDQPFPHERVVHHNDDQGLDYRLSVCSRDCLSRKKPQQLLVDGGCKPQMASYLAQIGCRPRSMTASKPARRPRHPDPNPKRARVRIDARKWRFEKLTPKKYGEWE
jgi:hypothetical protein